MEISDLIREAKKYACEFKLSTDWMTAGSVSAALTTSSGKIYTGICIDVASGIGFCAEHSAIAQMLKDRETRIEMVIAITDKGKILPPCGRCREFMLLINKENENTKVVIEAEKTLPLRELLPYRWL
jgi:cytidine deaminase